MEEFLNITVEQKKAILAAANILSGKLYSCTDAAQVISKEICETTNRIVGRRADQLNMRVTGSPYGKFMEQKAKHSNKPVFLWYFNELGLELLKEEFKKNPDNTKRRKKSTPKRNSL